MSDDKVRPGRLTRLAPTALTTAPARPLALESEHYRYPSEPNNLRLPELWQRLRKRLWLTLGIAAAGTLAAALLMHFTQPTYQASTLLEIGREGAGLNKASELSESSDSLSQEPSVTNIKTKMLVLKSQPLLEEVIKTNQFDRNPVFVAGLNQPITAAQEAAQHAQLAEVVALQLEVEQVRETRVLKLSFTHTDPNLAAAFVNGVAQQFIQGNFRGITDRYNKTASWLDRSTQELKAKVETAEQKLADYVREHKIFATSGAGPETSTLTTERLVRLHDQAIRGEADRMLKESLYKEVQAGRLEQLPDAFLDARLTGLQKELSALLTRRAQLAARFGPKNPQLIEVQQQIDSLEAQIEESRGELKEKLATDYERAARDEQSMKAALELAKFEAIDENQAAIQYNILKQDAETARMLYTDFLRKTSQANIALAEQHNNIRVIEPAKVPLRPAGPKRFLGALLGFALSLMVGLGLVFFLEYVDTSIKNVEDIRRHIQLPVLGVIPAMTESSSPLGRLTGGKEPGQALIADLSLVTTGSRSRLFRPSQLASYDNGSPAAEAYRALRTMILGTTAGTPLKTILVTSGLPGEGKTTTALNTAISLAQLGAAVLLLDCDLRKAADYKPFQTESDLGLANYLIRSIDLNTVIRRFQMSNLELLPGGPPPRNPAELLSSNKMKALLTEVSRQYDYIVLDSPPLSQVTDALVLSTLVDGVLLVVHDGKSTRELTKQVRQELTSIGANLLGVVLNNVAEPGPHYSYHAYSSGSSGRSRRRGRSGR